MVGRTLDTIGVILVNSEVEKIRFVLICNTFMKLDNVGFLQYFDKYL